MLLLVGQKIVPKVMKGPKTRRHRAKVSAKTTCTSSALRSMLVARYGQGPCLPPAETRAGHSLRGDVRGLLMHAVLQDCLG